MEKLDGNEKVSLVTIYQWAIDGKGTVTIEISDEEKNRGIKITLPIEIAGRKRENLDELFSMSTYVLKDESRTNGVTSEDGKSVCFETKEAHNWNSAKRDIVTTFDGWFGRDKRPS